MYNTLDLGRKICSTHYSTMNKLTYLRIFNKTGVETKGDHTSFKKAFGNTSGRILFVFIDLFMVRLKTEGADKDGPFEIPTRSNW